MHFKLKCQSILFSIEKGNAIRTPSYTNSLSKICVLHLAINLSDTINVATNPITEKNSSKGQNCHNLQTVLTSLSLQIQLIVVKIMDGGKLRMKIMYLGSTKSYDILKRSF